MQDSAIALVAVGRDPPIRYRFFYPASRFLQMQTVIELALSGKDAHLRKITR
jgi:hypothetical protein